MIVKSAEFICSNTQISKLPPPVKPEYAFIGRSNVGKSSLINMLCNNDKLAKTSATPGKTQLINHFEITSSSAINTKKESENVKWYLVDLPGYGFAKVSQAERKKWEKMIDDYLRKRETLVHVFLLIDSRHNPQKLDLDFVNNLGKWEIPFTLVFTKSDKENQRTVQANVKAFLNRMLESWQFLPRHLISSAVKKTGRENLLRLIGEMNEELKETK